MRSLCWRESVGNNVVGRNVKDALYDGEIFEAFKTTVSRAKKGTRSVGAAAGAGSAAETKSSIEEFEALMETIRGQANGEELTAVGDSGLAEYSTLDGEDEEEESVAPVGEYFFILPLIASTITVPVQQSKLS